MNINRNQNPTERVARAVAGGVVSPHECDKCGSIFFYQTQANQYTVSNYGVRLLSSSPQTLYLCVGCNELLIPGNLQNMVLTGGEREAFLNSVELGKDYKSKHDPTQLIKNSASINEVEDLKAEVDALRSLINNLVETLAENEIDSEIDIAIDNTVKKEDEEIQVEKITKKDLKKGL
jgi:hypothetical protein